MRQNIVFLILAIIVIFFILMVGILLAEGFIAGAVISLFIALSIMGYGFRLKRKGHT